MLRTPTSTTRRILSGLAVVTLIVPALLSGCGSDEPADSGLAATASDVTSVGLTRDGDDQIVKAEVINRNDAPASFTVTVAFASTEGTQLGTSEVRIVNVPAGKKKRGSSSPIEPPVPFRSQVIITDVQVAAP